jgi:hypothetical protein
MQNPNDLSDRMHYDFAPASVLAQTCSDQDLTTTPAPPTNLRSHELYLKQLHLALMPTLI